MHLLTHEEHHNPYALLAAIVSAFLVATGVGFIVDALEDDGGSRGATEPSSSFAPDDPSIAQAPWKIYTRPTAGFGRASNKELKALRSIAPKVAATVRNVYDAMLVSRKQLRTQARRWMTGFAARELRRKTPIPGSLTAIRTTRRHASIGIDARSRNRAAAEVEVRFTAKRGKKRLKFVHNGTLWLERRDRGWQVIAFDLFQRRRA